MHQQCGQGVVEQEEEDLPAHQTCTALNSVTSLTQEHLPTLDPQSTTRNDESNQHPCIMLYNCNLSSTYDDSGGGERCKLGGYLSTLGSMMFLFGVACVQWQLATGDAVTLRCQ